MGLFSKRRSEEHLRRDEYAIAIRFLDWVDFRGHGKKKGKRTYRSTKKTLIEASTIFNDWIEFIDEVFGRNGNLASNYKQNFCSDEPFYQFFSGWGSSFSREYGREMGFKYLKANTNILGKTFGHVMQCAAKESFQAFLTYMENSPPMSQLEGFWIDPAGLFHLIEFEEGWLLEVSETIASAAAKQLGLRE